MLLLFTTLQTKIVSLCGLTRLRDDLKDWRKELLGIREISRCAAAETDRHRNTWNYDNHLWGVLAAAPSNDTTSVSNS